VFFGVGIISLFLCSKLRVYSRVVYRFGVVIIDHITS